MINLLSVAGSPAVRQCGWALAVCAALLAGSSCMRADEAPATAAQPKQVVVFGDSITAGSLLSKADKPRLWVNQVETASSGKLRLLNEGKGGRPTAALAEFEEMLKGHAKVDLLVFALGANDARDTSGDCVPHAVKNLRTMIQRARAVYGVNLPILLVAPTNIRKDALGPTKPIADQREANLVALGTAYEGLAKDEKCSFFSLYGLVPPESLAHDGVHPDAAGNDILAKALLAPLLKAAGVSQAEGH